MQGVDINILVNGNNYLNENIPDDIIIVGKIDKLIIEYKYDQLDLSKVDCDFIIYENQGGESIKNHLLPNSLKELNCYLNKLTSLPDWVTPLPCLRLPNSLEILNCWNNQLTSLPILPNSLIYLTCSRNQLVSLPNLPNSLIELYCWKNQLTSIPDLPNSLEFINIGDINVNKIEYNPDYKNINCKFIDTKITIGDYIIKSKKDYISYMKDYEKYLLSKVKSARN